MKTPKHFFKKNKKEGKIAKPKYPSNSRIISDFANASTDMPELPFFFKLYKESLSGFTIFIFILVIIIVGIDLHKNIQIQQNIDSQREKLAKELKFWEDFISQHNDYRDAYFQVSVLEYKLGDRGKAKMYAEKGLSLDPNSQDGRKIEEFLNK